MLFYQQVNSYFESLIIYDPWPDKLLLLYHNYWLNMCMWIPGCKSWDSKQKQQTNTYFESFKNEKELHMFSRVYGV